MNTRQPVPVRLCSHIGCGRSSEAALEGKQFCRSHFIKGCYVRLDEIAGQIRLKRLRGVKPEYIRSFLAECASRVVSEALCAPQLNNLERSRLLDILLFASKLINQLRRTERMPRLVRVRLISGLQKDTWIEDTVTEELSKHGALIRCTHPYANGETVGLVRLDTGDRALARVVWQGRVKFAQQKVAVEIFSSPNFWNWHVEAGGRS